MVWDTSDTKTLQREERALLAAEKELGINGHLLTAQDYIFLIFLEGVFSMKRLIVPIWEVRGPLRLEVAHDRAHICR